MKCLVRQALKHLLAAALPRRWFVVSGPAGSRQVCLTFDDGPHPEHTPRLLDLLAEQGVHATFFVIGQQAERHPRLVQRIAAEGHGVGHHTFFHGLPDSTSASRLMEEIHQCRVLLASLLNRDCSLFRPPLGKLTVAKLWRLWGTRQTVVLWDTDPRDYLCPTSDAVARWFDEHPLQGGNIVLMHDDRSHAARVLPGVIAAARRRGLTFGVLTDWTHP